MALSTIHSTLWGFLVGVSSGFVVGLVLGRHDRLARVFEPYIVAFNSLPRIALVPLITMIFGFGLRAKVVRVVGEFLGGESGGGLGMRLLRWRPEHRTRV